MSDTSNSDDKTLRPSAKPTLSVKRTVDAGMVRQNIAHGRSNAVVVQKKRRRVVTPGQAEEPAQPVEVETRPKPRVAKRPEPAQPHTSAPVTSPGGRTLSDDEKEARLKALAEARAREVIERQRAEELARQRAEEERQRKIEEEARRRAAEEEARLRPESSEDDEAVETSQPAARSDDRAATTARDARPKAVEEPGTADREARRMPPDRSAGRGRGVDDEVGERRGGAATDARGKKGRAVPERAPERRAAPDRTRNRGRLTISNALVENQRNRSVASLKRHIERQKKKASGIVQPREKIAREVVLPEVITIQELANRMSERAVDVIKFLMKQGTMHKINDVIDADTAELIAEEFGHTAKRVSEADVEEGFIGETDDEGDLQPRPPVVTIMGHVDHGKTSLLDALRKANVVAGEAGGITQHIGAYQVEVPSGGKITFIDTPGHAAFTAMRARGARVTDIVVLVVAADDGVMPQTVEAINHAKAAEVPLIVAINKIDKPTADPQRVRTELLQHEIVVESMSGETLEVEVSALKKTGLENLLEAIHMQAELLELKANPDRSAEGFVIEAQLERGRGPVGTMLIQRGTLSVGNIVVAGTAWGRVRALIDDHGSNVATAGPSVPVEVLGLNEAPEAGDQFAVVDSESRAREITDYRMRKRRDLLSAAGAGSTRSLEQMMSQLKEAGKQEFALIVKGDVQGSVEAIANALEKLGTDEVMARIVHAGAGAVTESDITLATAANAVILGFNVRANVQAKQAAEREHVEIRYYSVIYDLVDDVKQAMSGLLAPTVKETFIGYAEIRQVFNVSKVGKVAGCLVTEGRVERGSGVRLLRDNVVIHQGRLSTLKRFKDEVKEVQSGQECGMAFENYQDIREGDRIECFTTETVIRTL